MWRKPESDLVNPLLSLFNDTPVVTYRNGQLLSDLNTDTAEYVYLLEFGFVKMYTIGDDGDEHILMILKRKELFPLFSLSQSNELNRKQKVFFEALGTVKLKGIPRATIASCIKTDITVSNAVLVHLGQRYLKTCQHLENLLFRSAHHRVMYCMVFFAHNYGHKRGDSYYLDTVFTHKIIGLTINLTRGTVTNEIEKLREKGLISSNKRRIRIMSMEKLKHEVSNSFNDSP